MIQRLLNGRWAIAGVIVVYLAVALPLARWSSSAGDEGFHTSAAVGMLLTGSPHRWNEDLGALESATYSRGLLITSAVAIAFARLGYDLFSARVLFIFPVLLAFFLFAFYVRRRHGVSREAVLLSAVLYFGQAMVVETSIYIRFYAPLILTTIATMILSWELWEEWRGSRRWGRLATYGAAWLAAIGLPVLDKWQLLVFPLLGIAAILGAVEFGGRKWIARHRRKLVWVLALAVVSAPLTVALLDRALSVWSVGERVMGRNHVTYWDNLMGLLRLSLALNVALPLVLTSWRKGQPSCRSFSGMLAISGTMTAIVFGIFNPHNQIFYSRYFVVPVAIACLGLGPFVLDVCGDLKKLKGFIATYVSVNALVLFTVFYCDRPTMNAPIAWLHENARPGDMILTYHGGLTMHGGAMVTGLVVPVPIERNPADLKLLRTRIEKHRGRIFHIYDSSYRFRDRLYDWTFGVERLATENSIQRTLERRVPGKEPLPGLRSAGLKQYEKKAVLTALDRLEWTPKVERKHIFRRLWNFLRSL